jgi:hypothetical protein
MQCSIDLACQNGWKYSDLPMVVVSVSNPPLATKEIAVQGTYNNEWNRFVVAL